MKGFFSKDIIICIILTSVEVIFLGVDTKPTVRNLQTDWQSFTACGAFLKRNKGHRLFILFLLNQWTRLWPILADVRDVYISYMIYSICNFFIINVHLKFPDNIIIWNNC